VVPENSQAYTAPTGQTPGQWPHGRHPLPSSERTHHAVQFRCHHDAAGQGHGPGPCILRRVGGFKPDGKFVYVVGGATLALFPKPEGTKAEHTAISFRVDDIASTIASLKRTGVVFEDYDFPGFKTIEHVCVLGAEKAAWFKDTEGNYLCLHEDLPPG
jgi:hypothetical protein